MWDAVGLVLYIYMVISANFCDVSGHGDLVCEGGLSDMVILGGLISSLYRFLD